MGLSEYEKHRQTAAKWILHLALEAWSENGWESMADWGEYDFEAIVDMATGLLPPEPSSDAWSEAYEFFADRAGDEA